MPSGMVAAAKPASWAPSSGSGREAAEADAGIQAPGMVVGVPVGGDGDGGGGGEVDQGAAAVQLLVGVVDLLAGTAVAGAFDAADAATELAAHRRGHLGAAGLAVGLGVARGAGSRR